ncbi:MAG: hypothetical protein KIS81_10905 [Maricaulaceae bacterium]|nr:hypothetical protein [Maricaulaceae bacterium]
MRAAGETAAFPPHRRRARRERLEAGPGITLSRWLDEDRYRAYRQRVDFDLEYRFGTGDTNDRAFMARVIWTF